MGDDEDAGRHRESLGKGHAPGLVGRQQPAVSATWPRPLLADDAYLQSLSRPGVVRLRLGRPDEEAVAAYLLSVWLRGPLVYLLDELVLAVHIRLAVIRVLRRQFPFQVTVGLSHVGIVNHIVAEGEMALDLW